MKLFFEAITKFILGIVLVGVLIFLPAGCFYFNGRLLMVILFVPMFLAGIVMMLKNPDLLKAARKIRIANGAGVDVSDVNRLLKQYEQMASVMKKFKKMGPLGMMSMMKKMGAMTGDSNLDSLMKQGGNFPPFK